MTECTVQPGRLHWCKHRCGEIQKSDNFLCKKSTSHSQTGAVPHTKTGGYRPIVKFTKLHCLQNGDGNYRRLSPHEAWTSFTDENRRDTCTATTNNYTVMEFPVPGFLLARRKPMLKLINTEAQPPLINCKQGSVGPFAHNNREAAIVEGFQHPVTSSIVWKSSNTTPHKSASPTAARTRPGQFLLQQTLAKMDYTTP